MTRDRDAMAARIAARIKRHQRQLRALEQERLRPARHAEFPTATQRERLRKINEANARERRRDRLRPFLRMAEEVRP